MNNTFWPLVVKEIKQRKWTITSYSLIAFSFLWLYSAIFPSFAKESAKLSELFESYPKAILEAFNIEQLQLTTFSGYISAEHFSLVWPLMAILITVSTAGVMLAGEVERGTMSLMLAMPVSRSRLYIAKYFAGMIMLLIFTLFSSIAIIPLAAVTNIDISSANVWLVSVLSFVFGWAIYSLAFMFSSVVKERSRVYFIMGGGLMLMYVANVVSGLIDSLDRLKYVSFFHYYTPDKALVAGKLSISSCAIFVAVAVLSAIVGYIAFNKRDIS